jgi:hypothetical protein
MPLSKISEIHGINKTFLISFHSSKFKDESGTFKILSSHGSSMESIIFVPDSFERKQVDALSILWNQQGFLDISYCKSHFEFFDENLKHWMLRHSIVAAASDISSSSGSSLEQLGGQYLISRKVVDQLESIFEDVISSKTWNNIQVSRYFVWLVLIHISFISCSTHSLTRC